MTYLRQHTQLITTLLILAFFSTGISPACHFISGKFSNFLEICTENGVKLVLLPNGFELPADDSDKQQIVEECLFCSASQINKVANVPSSLQTFDMNTHHDVFIELSRSIFQSETYSLPDARAPPQTS